MSKLSNAELAFQYVTDCVRDEYKDITDGEELSLKILAKFQFAYDNPPLEGFEFLFQKPFSIDEIRVALFNPIDEQIKYYPIILNASTNIPVGHPIEILRPLALSLIYLVHRKKWNFLEEFILVDGLKSLAEMTSEPNLYFRGQTMEILLSITDCDSYNWFQPLEYYYGKHYNLHRKLLDLADSSIFVSCLIENRDNSYPGGSMRALQLLAFWISWIRAMYTKDRRLILSKLNRWSCGLGNDLVEEEIELAKKLYDDFSKEQFEGYDLSNLNTNSNIDPTKELIISGFSIPTEEIKKSHINTNSIVIEKEIEEVIKEDVKEDIKQEINTNNELLFSDMKINEIDEDVNEAIDINTVLKIKEQGNKCYKNNELQDSIDYYSEALDTLLSLENLDINISNETESSLHYNRAAALWKQSKDCRDNAASNIVNNNSNELDDELESDAPGVFELLRCEQACRAALAVVPYHVKSGYRLANVLMLLGKPDEGLKVIDEIMSILNNVDNNYNYDMKNDIDGIEDKTNILKAMRRKCLASLIVKQQNEQVQDTNNIKKYITFDSSSLTAESVIGNKSAKILKQLQARNARERTGINHAWVDWNPPVEEEEMLNHSDVNINNNNTISGLSGKISQFNTDINEIDDDCDNEDDIDVKSNKNNDIINKILLNKNTKSINNDVLFKQKEIKKYNEKNKNNASSNFVENMIDIANKKDILKSKKIDKSEKKTISINASDSYNNLRKYSLLLEKYSNSNNDKNELYLNNIEDAIKDIQIIWNEKVSLVTIIKCLEEPLLLLFIAVIVENSKKNKTISSKIIKQIIKIERFETVFRLAIYGNIKLKENFIKAIEILELDDIINTKIMELLK